MSLPEPGFFGCSKAYLRAWWLVPPGYSRGDGQDMSEVRLNLSSRDSPDRDPDPVRSLVIIEF
jgi:hypothetical protein